MRPILTAKEAEGRNQSACIGFDGNGYTIGDRVEIHPGTDLWMMGAKYGTVYSLSLTPHDRVTVTMDKGPKIFYKGSEETWKAI